MARVPPASNSSSRLTLALIHWYSGYVSSIKLGEFRGCVAARNSSVRKWSYRSINTFLPINSAKTSLGPRELSRLCSAHSLFDPRLASLEITAA